MRMVDVILKKRNGEALTESEIRFFIEGIVDGSIPDYQATALLMAVWFRKMNPEETLWLTTAMVESGDRLDLSAIPGIKVDKHSTGGVGDKTTLILAPIVASCGVPVAKMSGRGLGHTGGTIDKLEAIPGFSCAPELETFIDNVKRHGIAVAGQTGHLVPADKILYALRDVTGTIDNVSLIAASIMSKKLAAGSDAIVLDVKVGSGAFMHTVEEAAELARAMVEIGNGAGRRTIAVLTDMDKPLGNAIGNALEVREAIEVLAGRGPADIREVCLRLAACMLELGGAGEPDVCRRMAEEAIASGRALDKLRELILVQGGDPRVTEEPDIMGTAAVVAEYVAGADGWICSMRSDLLGTASMLLGAGRADKASRIDPAAGIVLVKKPGDHVTKGETILYMHTSDEAKLIAAREALDQAIVLGQKPPEATPLIIRTIQ